MKFDFIFILKMFADNKATEEFVQIEEEEEEGCPIVLVEEVCNDFYVLKAIEKFEDVWYRNGTGSMFRFDDGTFGCIDVRDDCLFVYHAQPVVFECRNKNGEREIFDVGIHILPDNDDNDMWKLIYAQKIDEINFVETEFEPIKIGIEMKDNKLILT